MRELFLLAKLASRSLRAHPGRTALTLSGIIIAIASIILVISFGNGVRQYVFDEIEAFGTDIIQVEVKVPSTEHASTENAGGIAMGVQITTLTIDDADAVARLPHVVAYNAGIMGQSLASFGNTNKRVFLLGNSANAPLVDQNIDMKDGVFFSRAHVDGNARVVVLGSSVKDSFFGKRNAVGEKIKIKGQAYHVIGTAKERGSTGFVSFDDFVYMPVTTLQKTILGVDHISYFTVKVDQKENIPALAEEITLLLRDRHDFDRPSEDDFAVSTVEDAKDIFAGVVKGFRILLIALASVSLLVGGVGIMNVMLVSVAERISEIGLRKALGARRKDILRQFLSEALVISLFGGILGTLVGFALLTFGVFALSSRGIAVSAGITFSTIALAVGFSLAAGIIFGIYPALRATKISPMEAIRRE